MFDHSAWTWRPPRCLQQTSFVSIGRTCSVRQRHLGLSVRRSEFVFSWQDFGRHRFASRTKIGTAASASAFSFQCTSTSGCSKPNFLAHYCFPVRAQSLDRTYLLKRGSSFKDAIGCSTHRNRGFSSWSFSCHSIRKLSPCTMTPTKSSMVAWAVFKGHFSYPSSSLFLKRPLSRIS